MLQTFKTPIRVDTKVQLKFKQKYQYWHVAKISNQYVEFHFLSSWQFLQSAITNQNRVKNYRRRLLKEMIPNLSVYPSTQSILTFEISENTKTIASTKGSVYQVKARDPVTLETRPIFHRVKFACVLSCARHRFSTLRLNLLGFDSGTQ